MKSDLEKAFEELGRALNLHGKRLRKLEVQSIPFGGGTDDTEAPTIPIDLTAVAISYHQVDLSWTASTDNSGVSGYTIYRNGVQIATIGSTTFIDLNVLGGTLYEYTVDAYDLSGNHSDPSTSASVTTPGSPDTTPPTTPQSLAASNVTISSCVLTWSPSTDNISVTSYTVYRNGVPIASPVTITYTVTGLIPVTTYTFTVDAVDAAGNHSGQSSPVTITTPDVPFEAFYYVSTTGSASNPGTITQPWSLDHALNGGAGGVLTSGDTVYVRGGAYILSAAQVVTGLSGPSDPIKIRPYPGDGIVLMHNNAGGTINSFELRTINGVIFYDFIFFGSGFTRSSQVPGGVDVWHIYENPGYAQQNVTFRGCVFSNSAGKSVATLTTSNDIEYNGCTFLLNGSSAADDYNILIQSSIGNTKKFKHCVVLNSAGDAFRVYSDSAAALDGITIDGCVAYGIGELYNSCRNGYYCVGTTQPITDLTFTNNVYYNRWLTPPADIGAWRLGNTVVEGGGGGSGVDPGWSTVDTAWRYGTNNAGTRGVLLVVNKKDASTGGSAQTLTIPLPPGTTSNTVTVLNESRTITAAGGTFSDTFSAFASHAYAFPLTATAQSGDTVFRCGWWIDQSVTLPADIATYGAQGQRMFNLAGWYGSNSQLSSVVDFLDAAQAIGAKMYVSFSFAIAGGAGTSFTLTDCATAVNTLKTHPALAGYYIADEPELSDIAPSTYQSWYNTIKANDTSHPVYMSFNLFYSTANWDEIKTYFPYCDAVGMHAYPYLDVSQSWIIPHQRAMFDKWKTAYDDSIAAGKTFVATGQGFGDAYDVYRNPTEAELRYQTNSAVVQGVDQMLYWIDSFGDATMQTRVALMCAEMQSMAQEMNNGASNGFIGGSSPGYTSIDVPVATGTDDGRWLNDGATWNNAASLLDLGMVGVGSFYASYMRFAGITIPQGAVISAATLKLVAGQAETATLTQIIRADDVDNSAAPVSYADINGRTGTTANIEWTLTATTGGEQYTSPDIKTVIQEIVDRGGWASGNAITLLVKDEAQVSTNDWWPVSKNSVSGFAPPTLHIEYYESSTPVSADLTLYPGANQDDGRWLNDGSTWNNGAGLLDLGKIAAGSFYASFVRFPNIAIPQGSTVTAATVKLVAGNSRTATLNQVIRADDVDNSAQPVSYADINGRVGTTANVAWGLAATVTGTEYTSPSIVSVIQEVVNRAGWSSGNAITLLFKDEAQTSTNDWWPAARENLTYAEAKLEITYESTVPPSNDAGADTVIATGNYTYNAPLFIGANNYINASVSGNTFVYTGQHSEGSESNFPSNTWTHTNPTSGTQIMTRVFDWSSRQGLLIVYNWGGGSSVTVSATDMAGFTLVSGDQIALKFAEDPVSDTTTIVYNGTSFSVPMTGHTSLSYTGGVAGPTPSVPYFAVFRVIIGSGEDDVTPSGDTEAPSVPQNLVATAVSSTQINLIWEASTDNVGVVGYVIRRNGVVLTSTSITTHSDIALSPETTYSYTVDAFDAADNHSAESTADSATTDPAELPPSGANHYVGPSATTSGTGTRANPWTLSYALSSAGGQITAGDVVYLLDGDYEYSSLNVQNLTGTSTNPIIFKPEPGAWAKFVGTNTDTQNLIFFAISYVYFYDIEFTVTNSYTRTTPTTTSSPGTHIITGSSGIQTGVKFFGCYFHDHKGMGPKWWEYTREGIEFNGCIYYYNGQDPQHDHNTYMHNTDGFERILRDCIFHNAASYNVHCYDDGARPINSFTFNGCVMYKPTTLYSGVTPKQNLLIGGNQSQGYNNKMQNCFTYDNSSSGSYTVRIGYSQPMNSTTITGNYTVGRPWSLEQGGSYTVSNNTVYTPGGMPTTTLARFTGGGGGVNPGWSTTDVAWRYGSNNAGTRGVLLVVNIKDASVGGNSQILTIPLPPGSTSNTVTVLNESRTITASGGTFTDSFAAFASHAYSFPITATAQSGNTAFQCGWWIDQNVTTPSAIATYAAQGQKCFNLAGWYGSNSQLATVVDFLDAAQAVGAKMYVSFAAGINGDVGTSFTLANCVTAVNTLKTHPALAGYYIADEPELSDVTPSTYATWYSTIRTNDTNLDHKVFISFNLFYSTANWDEIKTYFPYCDAVGMHAYPYLDASQTWIIPHQRAMFDKWKTAYDDSIAAGKTFVATGQGFGDAFDVYRNPTLAELRYQTTSAVVQGIDQMLYWIDSFGDATMQTRVATMCSEMQSMAEEMNNGVSNDLIGSGSSSSNIVSTVPTSGKAIFVRTYNWDTRRANVIIYNYDNSSTVTVTQATLATAGVNLPAGATYELRNSANPIGDIITGTYNGSSITVPMTGRTNATPFGGIATPSTTFPTFGCFVLRNLS